MPNKFYIDVIDYAAGDHYNVASFQTVRECVRHIRQGGWEEPGWALVKTAYVVRSGDGMIEAICQYRLATIDESQEPVLMVNFADPLTPGEVYYYEHEYARFLVDKKAPSAGGAEVGMTRAA